MEILENYITEIIANVGKRGLRANG